MNRHTHEVTWHELGGHWANTHFCNAYEQDGELIVDGHRISGVFGEFPEIYDAYTGRQHRYGYFVTTRGLADDTMSDGLARHDHLLDRTTVVEGPDGLTSPSEPVFVARENARGEDDGYLLSLWWNRATDLSELLVHRSAGEQGRPVRCPHPSVVVAPPNRRPVGRDRRWSG